MFGKVVEVPQTESTPLLPAPLPGRASSTATGSRSTTARRYDPHASSGILFNHESHRRPGSRDPQDHQHGRQDQLGLTDELRLGNLDAERTGASPATTCGRCGMMLQQDSPDDYVVATGETHSVRRCEIAFGHVGLDHEQFVVIDEAFYRPAEVDLLIGSPAKAESTLGWTPTVGFETWSMMVDADIDLLSGRLGPIG